MVSERSMQILEIKGMGGIVLTAPIPRLAETLSRPPRLLLPNGSDDRDVHDGVFLLGEHYVSGED
jgi:hypothetical protein